MSSLSPASVLFSSDGYELSVINGNVIPTGTRALLISGTTPSGASSYVPSAAQGALGMTEMSNDFVVQSNATVTTSGSVLVTASYFGTQQVALIVNSTVTPTGTTPTLTYTIQEVDPGNGTTLFGNSATTTTINTGNSPGVFTAVLNSTTSPMIKVTWTITGATASFTGVYATIVTKSTPLTQAVSGTVTATNASVGTDGAAALGFDTQIGGKVTTAAPAYTTGNLNALSLTTLGGLRIDGVYVAGTTNATAADVNVSGGYVTTAAPTYTTGQLNPLSINTAGGLRLDGVTATGATVGTTAMLSGGSVTTAAPAYTTGQMSALSLTTTGLLRVDGTGGVFNNQSVGTEGAAALGFDTQVGGKVTTAAPTYTTGNLDALSLTTAGGLRIDGVYAAATTNATAADLANVGGYVTTAAPTYTTGQLNPISLNTAGGVRIDGVSATATATGSTAMLSGGAVTTAAPAYTTGQMDPLSLTTAGLLRIDGVYPINATTPTTDVTFVGGAVTTAAPAYTTGQLSALSLDTTGNLRVTAITNKAATSTVTSVAGATSSTSILASNTSRVFAAIYNNTTKNMFVLLGSGTASSSNFTTLLMAGVYYEVPNDYTGAINAIWANGVSGSSLVTELTP